MREPVPPTLDAAMEAFLRTAAVDLQRQLGGGGRLESIDLVPAETGTMVQARINVAGTVVIVCGSGTTVIDAYGDLLRQGVAESLLTLWFRALLP
jgi:hypothetical protein